MRSDSLGASCVELGLPEGELDLGSWGKSATGLNSLKITHSGMPRLRSGLGFGVTAVTGLKQRVVVS